MTKDIQSLINEKAKKKLEKEIEDFFRMLRQNSIWKGIEDKISIKIGDETHPIIGSFWHPEGGAGAMAFKELIPEYIEKESADFMAKIDQLRGDCDERFNIQEN